MSTGENEAPRRGRGGPGAFSEEEIAAVTAPVGDAELEEVDAAEIEEREPDLETPFERLVQKSRRLSPERVRAVLESVLFVADRPLSVDELYQATGIHQPIIADALDKISGQLREGISGIVLHEVAGGWQLRTDPGSAEYVRRFLRVKPQRLTRAALETLALIAYRQPVTRPEVEDIRGVDSGAVIKALLDRKLIKILGKKEEVGRPILYGTSREFLEFFALKDLSSLPTLREFQELSVEHQEIVERETAPKGPEGTLQDLADPTFVRKIEETARDSEAALEELEQAMSTAEEKSRAAAQLLEPKPAPPAGED
ncbi:MAG TPA: SMC-Scp complex subunit ScpB [Myxococcaceae bacterium]|jgi:segregation and condensation protein B|nr:SMC-Scp complex subunit ScpB [Myxococcaceae bacterium]